MNPSGFEPIDDERARAIAESLNAEPFVHWLGLRFEEVRSGYARLRLPFRPELKQEVVSYTVEPSPPPSTRW